MTTGITFPKLHIAHLAIATPFRCGLYETTRELVHALRVCGVDSRIVDPKPVKEFYPSGGEDRGVPLTDMEWAASADIVVSHSGYDGTPISETSQPIVHMAHGRPLSTFLSERNGGVPGYSYHVTRSRHERVKSCVTFWPEHEPHLRTLWREKPVYVIQPTVDLSYWTPGDSDYDFGGKKGGYNVVITDPWARVDASPFHVMHAFDYFRSMRPDARIHVFAADNNLKGYKALFSVLGESLGLVHGWKKDLREVYRAADMLITPHRIYTRAIREAMACGVQVVSGKDENPEEVEKFAWEMMRKSERPQQTRKMAEAMFDPKETARQFLEVRPWR